MAQKKENYSYSKLDTYCQCGFKYKLKYVDGHYIFCNSVATEFGTLVHATEEAIAKAIQAGEAINYVELKNKFILKMNELKYKYPTDWMENDKSFRTYQQKVYEYLEHGIYNLEKFMNEHPTYEICGIEQSFKFDYNGRDFKGFIDRVFHDKATDSYLIQDIKTWAIPTEKDHLTTPLQFVFYVMAAKELWGADPDKITCQYYLPLVVDPQTGKFGLTQNAGTKGFMKRGDKKLIDLLIDIDDQWFEPNPTPLCHWCEFCSTNANTTAEGRGLCPYFSHWTRENKTFDVNEPFYESDKQAKEAKEKHDARHAALLEQFKAKYGKNGGEADESSSK